LDKKIVLLVVLLGILVIFWIPIMTKLGLIEPPKRSTAPITEQTRQDTLAVSEPISQQNEVKEVTSAPTMESGSVEPAAIDTTPQVAENLITLETNVLKVVFSNYGGAPISIKLKNYKYGNGDPIEMLPECIEATPGFIFNGGTVNINDFVYESSLNGNNYTINNGSKEISYSYRKNDGSTITKRYRFYADRYDYDLIFELSNRAGFGFEREYSLFWGNKLEATELNIEDDYNSMWAMARMGTETEKFDDYSDDRFDVSLSGTTGWIATRSKYFTAVMVPLSRAGSGAGATGIKQNVVSPSGTVTAKILTVALQMEIPFQESIVDSFSVFVGPMDYEILKEFNEDAAIPIIDIGTTPFVGWLIRIFAYPIMWLLPRMYNIIPNYGLVIIIFSLLIKLITWPLSKKSVQSMSAMREIQPELAKLKEKHKKNPQALNKEMMKLYKERGVNPLAGCLPMLPQMPLFFALFAVFRSTILLRQAPFVLWWNDLSRGALSVTDPYIILVILMVVLMFVQQKMAMTDPKNKALTYIMPLMLGFFFYKASAGLVLYWACFSLFSFIEQLIFTRPQAKPAVVVAKK